MVLNEDRTKQKPGSSTCRHVIDLEEENALNVDDFLSENEFNDFISASARPVSPKDRTRSPKRNEPPAPPRVLVDFYSHGNLTFRPGKTVELEDGDFLQISAIIEDLERPDDVWLRGWRLRRTKYMQGMLLQKRNEVCIVLHVDEDDPRDALEQAAEEIPLAEVIQIRRLIMTNEDYPAHSFTEKVKGAKDIPDSVAFQEHHLVCRWKYVIRHRTEKQRLNSVATEWMLVKLRDTDRGVEAQVRDEELRRRWRGITVKGGSGFVKRPERNLFDLTSLANKKSGVAHVDCTADTFKRPPVSFEDDPRSKRRRSGMDEIQPPPIDLTGGSELPPSPCPSPIIEIEEESTICQEGSLTQKCSHKVSIDFTVDDEPRDSIDLTHNEEEREERGLVASTTTNLTLQEDSSALRFGHRLDVKLGSKTEALGSRTRCSGKITSWHSSEVRQKRNLQGDSRYMTPSKSAPNSQFGATKAQDTHSRQSQPYVTPESMASRSRGRAFNSSPIPFSLSSPRKEHPTKTASSAFAEIPSQLRRNDLSYLAGPQRTQAYVFGDCFCGAGGMSCAARLASLKVAWGFDKSGSAIESYSRNHPGTKCVLASVHQFIALQGENFGVDVLHLSPPCQYFSQAHTIDGKDDEDNQAPLFSPTELVKKGRPRVVTVEETAGLFERHRHFFNAVVHMLTTIGFSVRWKIINCAEYGLAQARKRLIIFASW